MNRDQVRVLIHLLNVLVNMGIDKIDIVTCPECGTSVPDPNECGHTLCQWCGFGPFEVTAK